ncbi:MAG: magnesium/cobalt transporter CorA, partial [Armatimonadota bacterium]|nr:magnesium/cobalt transporter CorA [Armatimonadota bacterium]
MIRLLAFSPSTGVRRDLPPEEISELVALPETLTWLDLEAPTPAEWQLLREEFDFHPLALEDAEHAHQRPKIEHYESFYLMVFYALQREAEGGEEICPREIALFVGPNYLVTVHSAPVSALAQVAQRWHLKSDATPPGLAGLLYAILDALVDDYFPVIDDLADAIDDLEDRIFEGMDEGETLLPVFHLKKQLLLLRRLVAPERDVLNVLMRREIPVVSAPSMVYFQDVYDHLVRLTDTIDSLRDLLTSALDAHLSVVSNRLNQVMRTLTALSAVLMSAGLIAGIYGM